LCSSRDDYTLHFSKTFIRFLHSILVVSPPQPSMQGSPQKRG
jgi:hypothetical protein